jgi:8-oxo-dGTP diphosphatase
LRFVKLSAAYLRPAWWILRPAHQPARYAASMQVVAVVIRRGDRYLVGQRAAHKHHGGLWEFPGGKLEVGESLADAAQREVGEELRAALVCTGRVLAVVTGDGIELHFLEASLAGEPCALEHQALRWCEVAELSAMPLAPLDRRFVDQALRAAASVPPAL